jgi:hypothetical protein
MCVLGSRVVRFGCWGQLGYSDNAFLSYNSDQQQVAQWHNPINNLFLVEEANMRPEDYMVSSN